MSLPIKLIRDAIVETVFEIRFSALPIPEALYGRIIDQPEWKGFEQKRLPGADLPTPIRIADEGLKFVPSFELISPDQKSSLRIGPFAVSHHRAAPYLGWAQFRPELVKVVKSVFLAAEGSKAERLGLRYINSVTNEDHFIPSFGNLNFAIHSPAGPIVDRVNVNFSRTLGIDLGSITRLATKDFVIGNLPPATAAVIDIDVFTPPGFVAGGVDDVMSWVERAHEVEKRSFFELLPDDVIEKLRTA